MVGTIELDRDGRTLLIGFPYREDLVEQVRSMPGRRWDRGKRMWTVPAKHAETVVNTFMSHGFQVAPEVMGILAGTVEVAKAEPKKEKAAAAGEDDEIDPDKPLSITNLNERVRDALRSAFVGKLQVIGEIVDWDKSKDRKHVFFKLVEKAPGGQKVAAQVEVAMFERTVQRVVPALETQGLVLQDGLEILIEARVDFYPGSGRFQLIIDDIRPEFTLGKLAADREKILNELRELGIAELNRELALPTPALRVGVLASPGSDGWKDFEQELIRSGIGFEVSMFPIFVQGDELRPTVLRGLDWFAERAADYDVLCIVRGGGSRTDLAWFDDRDVAIRVAKHPLKIVCGIGHDRDTSILDLIAHSEKTPTAAAGFVVAEIRAAELELLRTSERFARSTQVALAFARRRLGARAHRTQRTVATRLGLERERLGGCAIRVARSVTNRIRNELAFATRSADRLRSGTRAHHDAQDAKLTRLHERIADGARHRLEQAGARLETLAARQRLLDPARVLERGFALLRDAATGRILTRAGDVSPGQQADVQLRDGRARVRVDEVTPND